MVLMAGLAWSLVLSALVWRRSGDGRRGYRTLRESFGGVLLLGLEILVAADLIRTVAVAPIKLKIVSFEHAKPYITHLPVYSLKAAAGKFSGSQDVVEEGWVCDNRVHGFVG